MDVAGNVISAVVGVEVGGPLAELVSLKYWVWEDKNE